jgi:hypothetical protein
VYDAKYSSADQANTNTNTATTATTATIELIGYL